MKRILIVDRTAQNGVAAVELAFLVVLLLLMAAGTFEFGRTFWYYNALAKATRDGARAMSIAQKDLIGDAAASSDAISIRGRVVAAANEAKLNPPLLGANVDIACDSGTGFDACVNIVDPNPPPVNVRVAITGYTIDIGGIFPFFNPGEGGVTKISDVPLAPYTIMRYMN